MANDEICITRKIEVHLHLYSDDEVGHARRKEEYGIWNAINDNLFKVANLIATHQFFNDAYEFRAKTHSPQYTKIEKDLNNSQKLKLTQEQVRELKKEKSKLDKEIEEQMKTFLHGSRQNSTYMEKFPDVFTIGKVGGLHSDYKLIRSYGDTPFNLMKF